MYSPVYSFLAPDLIYQLRWSFFAVVSKVCIFADVVVLFYQNDIKGEHIAYQWQKTMERIFRENGNYVFWHHHVPHLLLKKKEAVEMRKAGIKRSWLDERRKKYNRLVQNFCLAAFIQLENSAASPRWSPISISSFRIVYIHCTFFEVNNSIYNDCLSINWHISTHRIKYLPAFSLYFTFR